MKHLLLPLCPFLLTLITGCGLPNIEPTPVDHLSTFTHTFELPEQVIWQSDFSPYDPIASLNDSVFSKAIAGATPLRIHGLSSSTPPTHDRYLSIASGTLIYDENTTLDPEDFKIKILSLFEDIKFYNDEMVVTQVNTVSVTGGSCMYATGEFKKNYSYARKDLRPKAEYYLWKHTHMFCLPSSSTNTAAWVILKEHRAPTQAPQLESVTDDMLKTFKLY